MNSLCKYYSLVIDLPYFKKEIDLYKKRHLDEEDDFEEFE